MRAAVVTLLLLAWASTPSLGTTVGGRLTSALYAYEGVDATAAGQRQVRVHQAASLTLGQLVRPEVSLHTYLRGTTDLADQAESDPRLRVYNAYLAWSGPGLQARLGRQRVLAGVGYGTIDGFRADARARGIALTLYAGPLVPAGAAADLGSWSDGNLWGVRVGTDRLLGTDAALSFASRQRDPARYAEEGRFTGVRLDPSAVVQRLVGADVRRQFTGGHALYGRVDWDLESEKLRRAEVSGRCALASRLAGQLEWFRRAPYVYDNSLFSAFPAQVYQEVGGSLHYSLSPQVQVSAHFAHLLYDGDSAQRLGVTAALGPNYSIGYFRTMGYTRASDGVVGSALYPLHRSLLLQAELDLTSYERFLEDAEERDETVTGSAGLRYRPTRNADVDLQVQGLRNPLFDSDMRLYLRASWRFFHALGRGER
ncbi:MAG: hypothetical protein AB1505_01260 [Candidatus Latescibacterota bacterium]